MSAPRPLALPHPRAHVKLNAEPTQSPLGGEGRHSLPTMILLSASQPPQIQSHGPFKAVPSCCSSQCSLSLSLAFFFFSLSTS